MAIDLKKFRDEICHAKRPESQYLGFNENQIDKEHNEVVLYVFITEMATFSADSEANQVPIGLIVSSRILRPQSFDRIPALYTDRHWYGEKSRSFDMGYFIRGVLLRVVLVCWFALTWASNRIDDIQVEASR